MWRALGEWIDDHPAAATAWMTVLLESAAIAGRFLFGFRSESLAPWTGGWRIHHSYIGTLLVLFSLPLRPSVRRTMLYTVGSSLLLSDLIHHFAVLWPLTGSPEFHFRAGKI